MASWRMLAPTLLCVFTVSALQEDSGLKIRSDTRVVEVDVTVRDADGKPVEGLTKADFTITDNGRPRPFTIFNYNDANRPAKDTVAAPSPSVRSAPLPPNTFTNNHVAVPPEGHSTIIVVDGVSGWFDSFVWASKGVQGLMKKLPPDEKVALYVIANYLGLLLVEDYTTDREKVAHAIKTFIPRAMKAAPPGIGPGGDGDGMMEYMLPSRLSGGVPAAPDSPQRPGAILPSPREAAYALQRATESVRLSLQALADRLRTLPGRKSVFWITEGFPPSLLRGMGEFAWNKTISALNDANIEVNTVDTDGLGGPSRMSGPGGILTMQQIAERTGGEAFFHRNDLDNALATGVADSRSSYTLAFYLSDLDGKYHDLKVSVDRPHLQLTHRQGYWARTDDAADKDARKSDLESVMLSPVEVTSLGITATIVKKPGTPRETLNTYLKLDSGSFSVVNGKAGWTGKIEEMFVELNAEGRELLRLSDKKQFGFTPAQKATFDQRGLTFMQAVPHMPGAATLSIFMRDSNSGRTGSLRIPLEDVH